MEKRRYGGLDFLKIIATVIIIFHHYQQIMNVRFQTGINYFAARYHFGTMVELFFVISGFVMLRWRKKISRKLPGSDFKSFIGSRYRRFVPMLIITTAVYELMSIMITYALPASADDMTVVSLWGSITNILCVQTGWCFRNTFVNSPTWYICVLMLCYIIFWCITAFGTEKKISPVYGYLVMIAVGFAVNYHETDLPFFNVYSSRGYISFFTGVLIAEAEDRFELHDTPRTVMELVLAALIIFIPGKNSDYSYYYILYPVIVIILSSDAAGRIFSSHFWSTAAAIQFHVYLWHLTVLETIKVLFRWRNITPEARIYMYAAALAAELVGTVSYFFLDKPANRLFEAILPKRKAIGE